LFTSSWRGADAARSRRAHHGFVIETWCLRCRRRRTGAPAAARRLQLADRDRAST